MVQYQPIALDTSFAAIADATRRGVLQRLGQAEASVTDLADSFHMSLTGMKKHIHVLETAGLVATHKIGRVRTCQLGPSALDREAAWIIGYRQLWEARFAALDTLVDHLKQQEAVDGHDRRK